MSGTVDAVVVGGGFFGCNVALALRKRGLRDVLVLEREARILGRASYVNQARVHNGYHYPRSLATARRSHASFERFCADYAYAVRADMRKVYAIARDSLVSPIQFQRFCQRIGAPCSEVPVDIASLFDDALIVAAFLVTERAFDAVAMAAALTRAMAAAGIALSLSTSARISNVGAGDVAVETTRLGTIHAQYVFNCTYAGLDTIGAPVRSAIKRELAEMVLIEPCPELRGLGITVMDGPFFSTMPFPAEACHSLSHVRYTPHAAWTSHDGESPRPAKSHATFMLRDAARFLPCLLRARYRRSLFELKAVLTRNEGDDGRPILFEQSPLSPRIVSILGGKFDNIYDILSLIDAGEWAVA